jgi:exonuclease SbcC
MAGLLSTDERRELKEEIAAVDEQMRQYTLDLKRLETKIDGRSISEEEVDQLRREYQNATDEHEQAIGAAKATEERLEDCRTRNAEWKQLVRDNESLLKEASTVDQLTRYLIGDAFVNFIANERLAGVCARASRQLRELTGGRLELDSDPDDGFFIRDNGNGGHERAPSSLSGGEMFLVSLSLALALSDTIQLGSAPLEFFFLDEGFGTLDAELLESVMTSLELLRSQHRAIGVITHVGALRERIARRLIVSPASSLQGSTIAYEVA